MAQPIAVVDAFTTDPYRGNPAGICILRAAASDAWMQSVAIEMNHAETAFLVKRGAGKDDGYDLRWFTPGGEVDLCGHPRSLLPTISGRSTHSSPTSRRDFTRAAAY